MNVLDLFSGIGGFSLGLERAGMRTVAFCEIDPYCRRVLAKHWPSVPCYDDVTTLTAARLAADGIISAVDDTESRTVRHDSEDKRKTVGKVNASSSASSHCGIDIICGGFPCQDISIAGKGAGLKGERSGLWSEYARIIGEVRPRYAIIENVSALLSRGLGDVLFDLSALGYDAEWHCIPASAVGAPHRRDRVWIVAYPASDGWREGQSIANPRSGSSRGERSRQLGGTRSDVADADNGVGHRRRGTVQMGWGRFACETADHGEFGRIQWGIEPCVGRSLDGLPAWLDRCIGRGLSYAESCRRSEILRQLWSAHLSQALRRAAGGLERIQQAEVLFAFVREYEGGVDEARLLVAGEEASEDFLRGLRDRAISRSAPRRSGQDKQSTGEHPDALQSVPRFLACNGEAYWAGSGWENAVPRVASGIPARMDRLRSLGNAVVPQIPELIGRAIMSMRMSRLQ